MPARNDDLHGNVPDKCPVALLVIDMINDLEFEGGEDLLRYALPVARNLAALKQRAKQAGIPVIYVNDNFGRWRSDLGKLLEHCLHDSVRGQPIAELLAPEEDDYVVLKAKHSGFFSSILDTLLIYLEVRTVIVTWVAGNVCVLFTANDAYMRDYLLKVPSDCVASEDEGENQHVLDQMRAILRADIRPSTELNLEALAAERGNWKANR